MLRKPSITRKSPRPAPSAPVAECQAPRENFRTSREESPSPVILIVERDRLLRWALFEVLSEAGFRVLTAPDGSCAESLIRQIEPDVALALVDDDSWPMTALTRATLQKRWADLPIVVTTQSDDPAVDARARKHGAIAVLLKPFEMPDVVALAERLTGVAASHDTDCRFAVNRPLASVLT